MNKQDIQNLINTVTQELMNISSSLDDSNVNKTDLINKTNLVRDLFTKNTQEIRLNSDPQYLALHTALKNIDDIFDELFIEMQKI